MRVRPATMADVDTIERIERASFGDPWSRDSFAALVRNPTVYLVVAEGVPDPADPRAGATVLGYLVAWFAADEAEIANVAVAAEWRGAGVGRHLLDVALRDGARRGVERTFLEVRESNVAARALYASRGFEVVGRRRNYYRHPLEDALILRRTARDPGGG